MSSVELSLELYNLMLKRLESTGVSEYQAQIYRELIELLKTCEDMEEAKEKFKEPRYYLGPSIALMQDKITAFKNAAMENGMPDVAAVYEKKLKEIEADNNEIYVAGHEQTALSLKVKHIQSMEAFVNIYNAYATLMCNYSNGQSEKENNEKDLRRAFDSLINMGRDFNELAKIERYRRLVLIDDAGYEKFVKEAPEIASKGIDFTGERDKCFKESIEAWEKVKSNKDAIKAKGTEFLSKQKRAYVVAMAPDSVQGRYEYKEVDSFE